MTCIHCAELIEVNDAEPYFENGKNIIAPFIHLYDGEDTDYDHDPAVS